MYPLRMVLLGLAAACLGGLLFSETCQGICVDQPLDDDTTSEVSRRSRRRAKLSAIGLSLLLSGILGGAGLSQVGPAVARRNAVNLGANDSKSELPSLIFPDTGETTLANHVLSLQHENQFKCPHAKSTARFEAPHRVIDKGAAFSAAGVAPGEYLPPRLAPYKYLSDLMDERKKMDGRTTPLPDAMRPSSIFQRLSQHKCFFEWVAEMKETIIPMLAKRIAAHLAKAGHSFTDASVYNFVDAVESGRRDARAWQQADPAGHRLPAATVAAMEVVDVVDRRILRTFMRRRSQNDKRAIQNEPLVLRARERSQQWIQAAKKNLGRAAAMAEIKTAHSLLGNEWWIAGAMEATFDHVIAQLEWDSNQTRVQTMLHDEARHKSSAALKGLMYSMIECFHRGRGRGENGQAPGLLSEAIMDYVLGQPSDDAAEASNEDKQFQEDLHQAMMNLMGRILQEQAVVTMLRTDIGKKYPFLEAIMRLWPFLDRMERRVENVVKILQRSKNVLAQNFRTTDFALHARLPLLQKKKSLDMDKLTDHISKLIV